MAWLGELVGTPLFFITACLPIGARVSAQWGYRDVHSVVSVSEQMLPFWPRPRPDYRAPKAR